MTKHRLQKLISTAGICSRRKAEELLIQERVTVNGRLAKLGDQADPAHDKISIDGVAISQNNSTRVLLLNKPVGVITSCHDPQGRPTVLSLLPEDLRKGLHPVGRLDANSRGALLITNNGDLTLQLTHPRYAHTKTYRAWVRGQPTDSTLADWRSGVMLDGQITKNAQVELLETTSDSSLLKIVLREGRNRQIRRTAEQLGHHVLDLQRTAIADLELKALAEGHWRELRDKEWQNMFKQVER